MSTWVRAGLRHVKESSRFILDYLVWDPQQVFGNQMCIWIQKREVWVGDINGKVMSTEIVVNTQEAGEIIKGKRLRRRTKEITSKRKEDREKEAKGKGRIRETGKSAQGISREKKM